MNPILSKHTWVSLSNEVRYRIRTIFNIPRSSNTVVNDGVIESDGVTNEDLTHLTIAKMQVYLDETITDFHKLFDMVLAKVNDEIIGKNSPKLEVDGDLEIAKTKKNGKKK